MTRGPIPAPLVQLLRELADGMDSPHEAVRHAYLEQERAQAIALIREAADLLALLPGAAPRRAAGETTRAEELLETWNKRGEEGIRLSAFAGYVMNEPVAEILAEIVADRYEWMIAAHHKREDFLEAQEQLDQLRTAVRRLTEQWEQLPTYAPAPAWAPPREYVRLEDFTKCIADLRAVVEGVERAK